MQQLFVSVTPLEYFSSLVCSDGSFALLEAAISLAQDVYPELDVQSVLFDIDQLHARLQRRVPADAGPLRKLRVLNQFFYTDLGFAGNVNDYYAQDNSFVHAVLHTRRGIPITLAVLWMELAQGLGLYVRGVGFPGHFLVKVKLPIGLVILDPLTGQSLSSEALSERLEPFRRSSGQMDESEAPLGLYLQSATSRDVVARMLRNLKEIYRSEADWVRFLGVQQRLVRLLPTAWSELRDRGLAYAELGLSELAVSDLEAYLAQASDIVDVDAIADRVGSLRKMAGRA